MINGNLTLDNARINANAPFTHASLTSVNGIGIPPEYFECIRVKCRDDVAVPVRLGRFTASDSEEGSCIVHLVDAAGREMGHFTLASYANPPSSSVGTFIFGNDNVLIGHVMYGKDLPGLLWRAISISRNMIVETPRNSFVLLPQCHDAMSSGHMRALSLNGTLTCADTYVLPEELMHTTVSVSSGTSRYALGVIGPYERPVTVNGLRYLRIYTPAYINGVRRTYNTSSAVWIGGEHIFLRHATASNIRIANNLGGIEIRSVLDG